MENHNGFLINENSLAKYIVFKNIMEATQSCLKDFDVLNKLGEGAFGQVFKVKRKKDGK